MLGSAKVPHLSPGKAKTETKRYNLERKKEKKMQQTTLNKFILSESDITLLTN